MPYNYKDKDMTTNQEAQTLEETLEKTDLGHIINENKKSVMIAGAVGIVLIIGYVIFSRVQTNQQNERLNKVASIETTLVEPFLGPKSTMKAEEVISKLESLDGSLFSEPSIYPSMIAVLQKLNEEGKLTNSILVKAQTWLDKNDERSEIYLLGGLAMATLWEDQGGTDQALEIYTELIKRPEELLKDKIFFHAGRLHLKKGNKEEAQKHFDYIFKKHKDSQYAKLARLYLSE